MGSAADRPDATEVTGRPGKGAGVSHSAFFPEPFSAVPCEPTLCTNTGVEVVAASPPDSSSFCHRSCSGSFACSTTSPRALQQQNIALHSVSNVSYSSDAHFHFQSDRNRKRRKRHQRRMLQKMHQARQVKRRMMRNRHQRIEHTAAEERDLIPVVKVASQPATSALGR